VKGGNLKLRIIDYFREREEARLEEAVKNLTPEERKVYLERVANRYLAQLELRRHYLDDPLEERAYLKEHPYTTEEN